VGTLESVLGASGFGLVLLGFVYLFGVARSALAAERKQASEELKAAKQREASARAEADVLEARLDDERERRRGAEDREATTARELAGLRQEFAAIRSDIQEVKEQVT
jgi:flagellar biosynthesis/type III secretory pathway M-ring protein FliF/YscJ